MHRHGFFPNRREDLVVLQSAVARSPSDYRAWCDIGNLLYSKRRYEDGIAAWERARDLAADFPQPRRNPGLAYFNQRGDVGAAWNSSTRPIGLIPTTPASCMNSINSPSGSIMIQKSGSKGWPRIPARARA